MGRTVGISEIIKNHDCKLGFEEVEIIKFENQSHWIIRLINFDIKLYFIDYCPYCGVKLL